MASRRLQFVEAIGRAEKSVDQVRYALTNTIEQFAGASPPKGDSAANGARSESPEHRERASREALERMTETIQYFDAAIGGLPALNIAPLTVLDLTKTPTQPKRDVEAALLQQRATFHRVNYVTLSLRMGAHSDCSATPIDRPPTKRRKIAEEDQTETESDLRHQEDENMFELNDTSHVETQLVDIVTEVKAKILQARPSSKVELNVHRRTEEGFVIVHVNLPRTLQAWVFFRGGNSSTTRKQALHPYRICITEPNEANAPSLQANSPTSAFFAYRSRKYMYRQLSEQCERAQKYFQLYNPAGSASALLIWLCGHEQLFSTRCSVCKDVLKVERAMDDLPASSTSEPFSSTSTTSSFSKQHHRQQQLPPLCREFSTKLRDAQAAHVSCRGMSAL